VRDIVKAIKTVGKTYNDEVKHLRDKLTALESRLQWVEGGHNTLSEEATKRDARIATVEKTEEFKVSDDVVTAVRDMQSKLVDLENIRYRARDIECAIDIIRDTKNSTYDPTCFSCTYDNDSKGYQFNTVRKNDGPVVYRTDDRDLAECLTYALNFAKKLKESPL